VVILLQKHIFEHIKLKAEEAVEAELFQQYGTDPDKMVSALQREALIALKCAQYFQEVKELQKQLSGEGQEPPDPLIELKKQELSQSAQRDQMNAQNDQAKLTLAQEKENNDMQIDQARLEQANRLAAEKNMLAAMKANQSGAKNANQTR
jgi:hypothetical protein